MRSLLIYKDVVEGFIVWISDSKMLPKTEKLSKHFTLEHQFWSLLNSIKINSAAVHFENVFGDSQVFKIINNKTSEI